MGEIRELARRQGKVRSEAFHKYGSIMGLEHLDYPEAIRDEWIKTAYAEKFGLQARMWKIALSDAFAMIKSKWANIFRRVKRKIANNGKFSKEEKAYAYYLLKSPKLLARALRQEDFVIDKFKDVNRGLVHKYLKSRIRKAFGRKPSVRKANTVSLDMNMYDFHTDDKGRLWLGVMGLEPRKRIRLMLSSSVKPKDTANMRLVIKGNRIEAHFAEDVHVSENGSENVVAVDMGFSEVLTSASGRKYGAGLGELLKAESDRLSDKNRKRNKLRALVKKYEEKGDFIKAEIIKANNLGKRKCITQKRYNRQKIENLINRAVKTLVSSENPKILVMEKLSFISWKQRLPKKIKRYFSSWLKGFLRKRIEYIAYLNGVQVEAVNPAYTSQVCHLCGSFGFRRGDKFHCALHGVADADYNASANLLARRLDPDISLFTPKERVKEILLARLRLPNQDSRHPLCSGQSESETAKTYFAYV